MHTSLITVTGAASALMIASMAAADFVEITWALVDPVAEGWTGGDDGYDTRALDTYRIYAVFDDSAGRVEAAGSFSSPIVMTTTSTDGAFWNSASLGAGDLPPVAELLQLPGFRDLQWDSWVTIGLTVLTPTMRPYDQNFYEQANGLTGDFTLTGTGWRLTGDFDQGNAVDNRVLLAQFTVAEGVGINADNWGLYVRSDAADPGSANLTYDRFRIPSACPADLDGDDSVGFADLTMLLNDWGLCSACSADLDGDGVVGFADLTALLAAWGSC